MTGVFMPRRKPEFYETQEIVYTVDVSLSEDHLNASGRLVGKVKARTVNIRNILADIKDKGGPPTRSPSYMQVNLWN